MGRHTKQTVDYFPHYVHHGKTLHIIEHLWGNDGYVFFYRLLEVLGDSEGHFYDCREETDREFLAAETRVPWITGAEILHKLSSMGIIDKELWSVQVIWMESFVESVKDAYRKRAISAPVKPQASVFLPPEIDSQRISGAGSAQSKEKKRKENNPLPPSEKSKGVSVSLFERFWKAYPNKKSKGQAEKAWLKIKPSEQLVATMVATIERAETSAEWQKDGGQYIPHPATWLNAKGWEDEYGPLNGVSGAVVLPPRSSADPWEGIRTEADL